MTLPNLCQLATWLRAFRVRRSNAGKQVKPAPQSRPFYREPRQDEGERWIPDRQWWGRRNL